MQATDAGRTIKRLLELATEGPGTNPEALKEAQEILVRLGGETDPSGYLSEKLSATTGSFEIWLSDSQWQTYGTDPLVYRAILLQNIEKLRKALARGAAGQD